MRIEHIAFNVQDPVAAAKWYVENLGLRIVRQGGAPDFGHFLTDEARGVLIEIYRNPALPVPEYANMAPGLLHLALLRADAARLVKAGGKLEGEIATPAGGDHFAVVRDPWGLAIQLVKRAKSMI
jgi:glyoxylase I family protein